MSWEMIFGGANLLAMVLWVVLIALPRTAFTQASVMYVGVGLLCFAYGLLMVLVVGGLVDPAAQGDTSAGSFTSIAGVRALFASDGGLTIGWIHYLAFDLFVGLWIAKDADHKQFSRWLQAPILLLTFVAGPIGLFLWLLIRERRARGAARPRRVN